MNNLLNHSLTSLKNICEKITKSKIRIYLTSEFDQNKKAGVTGNSQTGYDILITGNVKLKKLITVLAHELAHITLQTDEHSNDFYKELKRIKKEMEKLI